MLNLSSYGRQQAALLLVPGIALTGPALAQTQGTLVPKPDAVAPLPLAALDAAAFAEWEEGVEKPLKGRDDRMPTWVVWNSSGIPGFTGTYFGDSKKEGPRHLRVGFTRAVPAGTVLVRGGGKLSYLKEGVAYPGDLGNEEHWAPAQRLDKGGITEAGVRAGYYATWILPPGTRVRALRFSHTPKTTDTRFSGWLGGLQILPERLVNLAPQAQAASSESNEHASRINNSSDDGWRQWVNYDNRLVQSATRQVITEENAPWVMLAWPEAVTVDKLAVLSPGFATTEVQVYQGSATQHPRDAAPTDWVTVKKFRGLHNGYPTQLWANFLALDKAYTTRGIRLRLTSTAAESHSHLKGASAGGKRVYVSEIMALGTLGDKPIPVLAVPEENALPKPPIPVKFNLAKAGYVTLVIEDSNGKRIRNLVSETQFPAGANIAWWDGMDDLGRDPDAARHGLYKIPPRFVEPGKYTVRGLVRDALETRYEFSVYMEGNPPWPTQDTSGGWMTNHTAAQAALFVPASKAPDGKALIYLGSLMSEGGSGMSWLNEDGRKLGGRGWVGGNFTSAPFMATDITAAADPKVHAYVASVGESARGKAFGELRITGLTRAGDKAVLRHEIKTNGNRAGEINGFAAGGGVLVLSMPLQKQVMVVEAVSGKILSTHPMERPAGLAFEKDGALLLIKEKTLVRFPKGRPDGEPQVVVPSGLKNPGQITVDEAGNIYISDRGGAHQVKVFDRAGKLLRTIGKPGAPMAGPYDELKMHNPAGLAVDARGQLWVTENDYLPKRVSVWTLEGKFVKAYYGPGKYGGGGTLDSFYKDRFYYADEARGTLEFSLDWKAGTSKLVNILYRPTKTDLKLPPHAAAPEYALYRNGVRYMSNAYNSNPTAGAGVSFLFQERKGLLYPVSAVGLANYWDVLKGDAFKASWPQGANLQGDMYEEKSRNQVFFIWSDLNTDAQVQPEEVQWRKGTAGGMTIGPDFSLNVSRLSGKPVQFQVASFNEAGVPVYEINQAKELAPSISGPGSSGGDQLLVGKDGLAVATLGMRPYHAHSFSGSKDGVPTWSYPNAWPGLHASHEAARPDRPGMLVGPTRLLGGLVSPKGSEVGQLWGVNGNLGNLYLFTADGLFVATLFEDVRLGRLWRMPAASRNMLVENVSLHDENFWPTLTQTPDGQVYINTGADMAIMRLDGLDTLRRIPAQPLDISVEDLKAAQNWLTETEARRQANQGSGLLEAGIKATAPVVDGNVEDWKGANWIDIDKSGTFANFDSNSKPYNVTATLAVSGDKLFAAWKTGNANLLNNSGKEQVALFKTGGALDIMLGTNPNASANRTEPVAGDLRLLMTQVAGKTRALLYRAVVPGTKEPVAFSSPWRTITLDSVTDVSEHVTLAGKGGNFEISIPLSVLGLKVQADQTVLGDLGILRGNGEQTTARVYWSNKATGITSDVPSEAQLTPRLWGKIHFTAQP